MKRLLIYSTVFLIACNNNNNEQTTKTTAVNNYKKTGTIERLDSSINDIISKDAQPEIIAEGFEWSEGPLWVEKHNMLLFSDVPMNTVFKWTEEKGKEVYLKPSGYTADTPSDCKEPGSNGLIFDKNGNLVLCQHGNRRMARMDAPLDKPEAKYITIADKYNGKRFSSPNDAVYNSSGELFFTDPPYGLKTQDDSDPKKEIKFNGVYKVKENGEVLLMTDSITRPNGIAFMPGEKTIIVANSDPAKPNWYAFDINAEGNFTNGRIFHSAADHDKSEKGLPDGFKIDKNGNVFATGPGGIWIFNSAGKLLGKIKVPESTSNCAFSADEKTLYITNDMYVLRVKLRE
jgi:gluconolactonase